MPLKLFVTTLLALTLFVNQKYLLGDEKLAISENPALKKAVVEAIQKYYFKPVNIKEFEKSSLSEILQVLDKDSSLIQNNAKKSDFVRGFKNKKSIKDYKIIAEKIGTIQISYFSKSTVKEFEKSYGKLTKDGISKLILDLRGNEGGDFDSCLKITERFVSFGETTAIIQEREKKIIKKSENDSPIKIPMIILVDSHTASSAEFLASSLREQNQAKIVGLPTQGKRTIQKMIPVESMWLSLTVGAWKTVENSDDPERIEPDFSIHGEEQQLEKAISLLHPKEP
ncbi:MAG: hypothetical protein HYT97_09680 [Elusimicrobia bacterium]|nr:hypothetical protein [Elusimicrobiota bacterium]